MIISTPCIGFRGAKRFSILLVAVSALMSTSCGGRTRYANITEYPSRQHETLVVIGRPFNDLIGYVEDGHLIMLSYDIGCLGSIERVLWSESGAYVLLESYGEGDQNIHIYEFQAITDAQCQINTSDITELAAYRYLDPYLHGLTDIAWIGDHTIRFRSTGNFLKFDYAMRRAEFHDDGGDSDAGTVWLWDLTTDSFRPSP